MSYTFTNNIIYQENGELISDVWGRDNGTKIKVNLDRNCYWIAGEPSPEFYGLSFAGWQKLGRDRNTLVADPLFVDPENFDFRFRRQTVARKRGFCYNSLIPLKSMIMKKTTSREFIKNVAVPMAATPLIIPSRVLSNTPGNPISVKTKGKQGADMTG